jgi:hypothetical protein
MRWNAVYEPSADEGLGVIVAADKSEPGMIFRRFAPSGMSVLHYPAATVKPGGNVRLPTAKILVHRGDWRVVGRAYREQIEPVIKHHVPPPWLDQIAVLGGCPNFGPIGRGTGDSAQPLKSFVDMSSHLLSWPYEVCALGGFQEQAVGGSFPAYVGDYVVRADMGGAASLKQAIGNAHACGQRVILNIAFHSIHRDAKFLAGRDPADFAVLSGPGANLNDAEKNFFACMGYKDWQDQLIKTCVRLLKETGADGFYLDEGGGAYWPCFNAAHGHKSPYNLGEEFWGAVFHRRLREAMDQVNPQAMLMTETVNEALAPYIDASHMGETPTREFPTFKFVFPARRTANYAPVIPAMLNDLSVGADSLAMSDHRPPPEAIEYHEQIQGKCGVAPPIMPFKDRDPDLVKKLTPTNLRWHELRSSFGETLSRGDSTLIDPQAVVKNPGDYVARLWRGPRYWLLNAGHFAAWPQREPLRFRLPELPPQITRAYEFDLTTLTPRETTLTRDVSGIYVTVRHGFSAVLLPMPDCPPLLVTSPIASTNPGSKLEIQLDAFAPWRGNRVPVQVRAVIEGIHAGEAGTLPATINVDVPADALRGCYFLRVSGDCLPLKRDVWVR